MSELDHTMDTMDASELKTFLLNQTSDFIPTLTELLNNPAVTFDEINERCSSLLDKIMKRSYDKDKTFHTKFYRQREESREVKFQQIIDDVRHYTEVVNYHKECLKTKGPGVCPVKLVRDIGVQYTLNTEQVSDSPMEDKQISKSETSDEDVILISSDDDLTELSKAIKSTKLT